MSQFISIHFMVSLIFFSEPNQYAPKIISKIRHNDKPAFHGELKENESVVSLKPPLAAIDRDEIGGASMNVF